MPENEKYYYTFADYTVNVAVIKLDEQVLGGSDALKFTALILELVSKHIKCLVVDLSQVTLINSSGMGMLVSGLSTLKKNDIALLLANVPEKVQNLLSMTHLDKVFKIVENMDEALSHYK